MTFLKQYSALISVAVLAVLGVLLWMDMKHPVHEPGESPKVSELVSVAPADVTHIDISAGPLTVALNRSGSAWAMEQPMRSAADADAVKSVTDGLLDRTTDYVAQTPSDLAKYGLDKPQATVTFRTSHGSSTRILIGGPEPSKSNLYALNPDTKHLFVIASSDANSVIGKTINDFRDKTLMAISDTAIRSISLRKGASNIELDRTADGKWNLAAPWHAPADGLAAGDIARTFSQLKADKFVDPADRAAAGRALSSPAVTATVVGQDGKSHILKLGSEAKGKTQVYALSDDRPQEPVMVAQSVFQPLEKSVIDLRSKQLLDFDTAKVKRLEVSGTKGTWTAEKTGDTWKIVSATPPVAANKGVLESMLTDLTSPGTHFVADNAPNLSTYGLAHPAVNVTVTLDGGAAKTFAIGNKSGADYYARGSDSPAVFQISTYVHDSLNKSAAEMK